MLSGYASRSDDRATQILVYSHCDDIDRQGEHEVELHVRGLKPGQYRLSHYRIDGDHSNAHTVWQSEGRPKYPQGAQYETIKSAGALQELEPERVLDVAGSDDEAGATLRFSMPAHAISLLTLRAA